MIHGHTRTPRRKLAILAAALIAAGLVAPRPAAAETATWKIDPDHTTIGFEIKHLFSKVRGRFDKFEGTIDMDESDLSTAKVSITIDPASIDTNEASRDKDLRSSRFFDVEKFPKITFVSNGVRRRDAAHLSVKGDLTMKGVTKSVLLDVEVLGFGDAYGARRAGFEATTRINRQDFGVSWNDVVEGGGFLIGDEVDITLNVEAKKQKPKPAPQR